jgi:D-alanine-D-alanine ligase
MSLRVLLAHNAVADDASTADRDVLTQVDAIESACRQLGHTTTRIPCTLDLQPLDRAIADSRSNVVFNLVESLGGTDRLATLVPSLLEARNVPFTGSGSRALNATNDKPRAKSLLRAHALPTPAWATLADRGHQPAPPLPCIVKAVWEHASLGLDDQSLIPRGDETAHWRAIEDFQQRLGTTCFAEQFIDGREFNLSLLAGANGPQVLPPAEIDFSRFPADKPRIVGHAAKWDEQSFEFVHTPRRFTFPPNDEPLLRQLTALALRCWQVFDLHGYARVDFRVDQAGQPWILEVNTNPCLSPDAGFAAALDQSGIDFATAIDRILRDALRTGVSEPATQI